MNNDTFTAYASTIDVNVNYITLETI